MARPRTQKPKPPAVDGDVAEEKLKDEEDEAAAADVEAEAEDEDAGGHDMTEHQDDDLVDAVEATPDEAEALIEAESMAVAIREEREQALPPANVLPSPGEWEATMAVARTIAGTPFVPESYRGQPEAVVAAILTGREMGIGPMESLRQIHMIDGRPAFAADLMMSKMRSGGVVVLDSSVSAERAWIKAKRKDTGEECEVEWTFADATAAGLTNKKNWKTYPADMLWARCVGRLARRLGSDLLGGLVYSSEEMGDWDESGYGGNGSSSYGDLQRPVRPTSRDGVALVEGAPLGWAAIAETLKEIDAGMDWQAWISQALGTLVGKDTYKELDEDERIDCGIKIGNGIAHLIEALEGRDFPPPDRVEIQQAFEWPDSVGVTLDGPDEPLDPTEAAATERDLSDETDDAATDPDEGTDAAEKPGDAALGGEMPATSSDDIPFGE